MTTLNIEIKRRIVFMLSLFSMGIRIRQEANNCCDEGHKEISHDPPESQVT